MDNEGSLNAYFQPSDSIPARPSNFQTEGAIVNQVDINSKMMRSSISGMHLKNFSFNSGTGGTIVLGGQGNGNGYLYIKDASGNIIVQGDNTGLTVFGGNIVVKNADNTTVIDTSGVVSTANFAIDELISVSLNETASLSYVDLPGSTFSSFVLDRDSILLLSVTTAGYNVRRTSDHSARASVQLIDSVDGQITEWRLSGNWFYHLDNIDFVGQDWSDGYNLAEEYVSFTVPYSFSAGTHSLKLQYKAVSSGTASISAFLMGYVILGS